MRSLGCLLGRHELMREIDRTPPHSIYLQCVHCQHRTAGWVLTEPPPRISAPVRATTSRPNVVSVSRSYNEGAESWASVKVN